MSTISVAQARRVAELAFMGFLFFLLRNVMSAIFSGSGAQSRLTSFHGISILPRQECHECYFSGSGT